MPLEAAVFEDPEGLHAEVPFAIRGDESIRKSKNPIRARTRRKVPVTTPEWIDEINPVIRQWVQYYRKAQVWTLPLA